MDVQKLVNNYTEQIIKWRRDLHQIPELGFDLPQTTAYVKKVLTDLNIEFKELVNGSAIVALIPGADPNGLTVALRADMDALPIKEETGLEFASTNGNMHACGHDAHTASLLGAAAVLKQCSQEFKGNVKLLFQPSEEINGGALPMIEEGCLNDPPVDYVIGQHVGLLYKSLKPGQMGTYLGCMMASLDEFLITFKGRGGHGAYPQNTIDPIPMAATAVSSIQSFIARRLDPLDSAVFTIGQIHGGSQYNVIPDTVSINGTCRCLNPETRKMIAEGIKILADNIAKAYGGSAIVDYKFGYPVLENDISLAKKVMEIAKKSLGEDKCVYLEKATMGSEDFAYFAEKVPSVFFIWNTSQPLDGICYGNHNSKFLVDETTIPDCVKFFVEASLGLLNEK